MKTSYIGLGANLGDAVATLQWALQRLDASAECQLRACSSFYRSRPLADMDQPDYVNAVAELVTDLSPPALLALLHRIEDEQGRERLQRWGARTLDLDILLYADVQWQTASLTIPHIGLTQREFVVFPLLEIAPQLVLPDGRQLAEVAQGLDWRGMEKMTSGEHA
ncbi:MAG: 2-amino-4-hydroxy-6-hydroxymethyldihydropteridine diphosphokinase [Gammaproteobacteria bacterium]|nr:2-amino-4-hydroxy-6-hydroxymethyldihydropteridine diphosphokinase [Gammaproteobacteria bacterium]